MLIIQGPEQKGFGEFIKCSPIQPLWEKIAHFPTLLISSAFLFSKLFHHRDKHKQTSIEKISCNITVKKKKSTIESFIIHHLHMTHVLEIYHVVNSIRKFKDQNLI